MDTSLIARVGLSRLRLPLPMAKLQIVHGAARALLDPDTAAVTREAFLDWITGLNLESEILEALCALVLAGPSERISPHSIRSAIRWPSILSDVFIGEALGTPLLFNSWAKSHSGEVSAFFRDDEIEAELSKGQIVPRILRSRLSELEGQSGKPMLKQWAYEFDRLLVRVGPQTDGHWTYFSDDERERSRGQFVARRGHLARSAYLRTLALAFDRWGMPEKMAISEAMYATPIDFSWIRMLPGEPPSWALPLHGTQPRSINEWEKAMGAVALGVAQDEHRLLMHLNAPVLRSKRFQADVEVITLLHQGEDPAIEDVFHVHDWLPGHVYIHRSPDWAFALDKREQVGVFPLDEGSAVLPALLPAVGRTVGYLHSELLGRMPYLPANYTSDVALIARPRVGGADLQFHDMRVGEFRYWNWRWSPAHDKDLGPHCAVSVTLATECLPQLLQMPGMKLMRAWRAIVLTRDSDYSEWQRTVQFGTLPVNQ